MRHYTHNPSIAYALRAWDVFPLVTGQKYGYALINSYGRCASHGEDRLQLEKVLFIQARALLENITFMDNRLLEERQGDGREGQSTSCVQVVKFDGSEHSRRKIEYIATK